MTAAVPFASGPPRFARGLNGSTDYFSLGSPIVVAAPFTIMGWVWLDDTANTYAIATIGTDGSNNHRWVLQHAAGTGVFSVDIRTTSSVQPTTSNSFTTGVWQHVAFIEAAADDHTAVLNGDWANRGTDIGNRAPSGVDITLLGARPSSTGPERFLAGRLARFGVWDVALGQGEVEAGKAGVWPGDIRANDIISLPPLGLSNPEPDWAANRSYTVNGSPAFAKGPPVRIPPVGNRFDPLRMIDVPAGGGPSLPPQMALLGVG